MSGSGRTPAGQFSNQVVNGITSTDTRPEGQTRKHWPKRGDSIEQWLILWRDSFAIGPVHLAIGEMVTQYQQLADNLIDLEYIQ
jgi:hypothetical protein